MMEWQNVWAQHRGWVLLEYKGTSVLVSLWLILSERFLDYSLCSMNLLHLKVILQQNSLRAARSEIDHCETHACKCWEVHYICERKARFMKMIGTYIFVYSNFAVEAICCCGFCYTRMFRQACLSVSHRFG